MLGANKFQFSATINNGQFTLVSGSKTFSLKRVEDNPLDQGGASGGGGGGANVGETLGRVLQCRRDMRW